VIPLDRGDRFKDAETRSVFLTIGRRQEAIESRGAPPGRGRDREPEGCRHEREESGRSSRPRSRREFSRPEPRRGRAPWRPPPAGVTPGIRTPSRSPDRLRGARHRRRRPGHVDQGPTSSSPWPTFRDRLQGSLGNLKGTGGEGRRAKDRQFLAWTPTRRPSSDLPGGVALLTTPPGFRPLHLEYAVAKGCHVFMEKSMAVDGPASARCSRPARRRRRRT